MLWLLLLALIQILYACVATGCSFLPDIALLPFFHKVSASKNEGSKRGNIHFVIENALVDMDL
jgi:hypothetical protein